MRLYSYNQITFKIAMQLSRHVRDHHHDHVTMNFARVRHSTARENKRRSANTAKMITKIILSIMVVVFLSFLVTNYSGKLAVISIIHRGIPSCKRCVWLLVWSVGSQMLFFNPGASTFSLITSSQSDFLLNNSKLKSGVFSWRRKYSVMKQRLHWNNV